MVAEISEVKIKINDRGLKKDCKNDNEMIESVRLDPEQ
jgi:hypothetical protein